MNRHDELIKVYRDHADIGHVINLFTDVDFTLAPAFQERPVNEDGSEGTGYDWFGTYWQFVPEQPASIVLHDKKVVSDITKWREQLKFPDLSSVDWEKEAQKDTGHWDRENKLSLVMFINGMLQCMRNQKSTRR